MDETTIVQLDEDWAKSKYLQFHDEGWIYPGAKTRKYAVYNLVTKSLLGFIKWKPGWRQYAFYPNSETIFDQRCMLDLAEFCKIITEDHKKPMIEKNRKKNMLARRQRRMAQLASSSQKASGGTPPKGEYGISTGY